MKKILIIVLLIFFISLYSVIFVESKPGDIIYQTIYRPIGIGVSDVIAHDIIQDENDVFIIMGESFFEEKEQKAAFIFVLNEEKQEVKRHEMTFKSTEKDKAGQTAYSIIKIRDESYILGTWAKTTIGSSLGTIYFSKMKKKDESVDALRTVSYGGFVQCTVPIYPTRDGGLVFAGPKLKNNNKDDSTKVSSRIIRQRPEAERNEFIGDWSSPMEISVIKLNENLNKEWSKSFGESKESDQIYNIIQTDDNGFALIGNCYLSSSGLRRAWITKLDRNGNIEWEKTFGAKNSYVSSYSIIQTDDKGYIFSGNSISAEHENDDIWIIKINKNGEKEWGKSLGLESSDDMDLIFHNYSKIIKTLDGGYIVAGSLQKNPDYGNGWIVKLDKNGNKEWSKVLGENRDCRIYSIIQATDGNYVLVGYKTSKENEEDKDLWILKIEGKPITSFQEETVQEESKMKPSEKPEDYNVKELQKNKESEEEKSSSIILDFERVSTADVLYLRNGDVITGTILNKNYNITTSYTQTQINNKMIKEIYLESGENNMSKILTINNNKISGFISNPTIVFKLKNGNRIEIRREKILKLVFRIDNEELQRISQSQSQFLILKNGDYFSGNILEKEFCIKTTYADIYCKLDEIKSITQIRGENPLTKVEMINGDLIQGILKTENINILLDIGPEVRIFQDHIDLIYCQEGFIPYEKLKLINITSDNENKFLKRNNGLEVLELAENCSLRELGIEKGDILTNINGEKINSIEVLDFVLKEIVLGEREKAIIEIVRNNKEIFLDLFKLFK